MNYGVGWFLVGTCHAESVCQKLVLKVSVVEQWATLYVRFRGFRIGVNYGCGYRSLLCLIVRATCRVLYLRFQKIPLGPLRVFVRSNFPLAFSVVWRYGSAFWRAGCSCDRKGRHSGAIRVRRKLVCRAIRRPGQEVWLPEGLFSLLFAPGYGCLVVR